MTHDKYTYIYALDTSGRLVALTQTPTIYAVNGRTSAEITSDNYTFEAVSGITGCYRLYMNDYASSVDFLASIVPHTDDQATVADIVVISPKVDDNIDDILEDTSTTLPLSISEIATWVAANISSSVTAGKITQIKGDSWTVEIADLTLDDNLIQLAIKESKNNTDDESIIFIDNVTGLLRVNGKEATAGDGSLSYTGTTLTFTLKPAIAAALSNSELLYYGIQSISAAGKVSEPYGGIWAITNDVVKATS